MKKKTICIFILFLLLTAAGCQANPETEETPAVGSIHLTMEISALSEKNDGEDWETVGPADFTAEEGSTVLEATQLYCMANDISLRLNSEETGIAELNGLEEDKEKETGWICEVNGKTLPQSASGTVLEDNDRIVWKYTFSVQKYL